MILHRKIYQQLIEWKRSSNSSKAILIKGARRVGKSFIAEEFAKKEYKNYILIDFSSPIDEHYRFLVNMVTNIISMTFSINYRFYMQRHCTIVSQS